MKVWRHEYQVRGKLRFPLDMLRYDGSYPLHETEAHAIETNIAEYGAAPEPLTVTLVHYDSSSKWEPTAARWRSFGWEVLDFVPGARGVRRERREW